MKLIWIFLIMFMSVAVNAEPFNHFEKLKSLEGQWKQEADNGKDFYITFQQTANGSALVENWMYKGASHSLTLYHKDGNSLLATHYCPQENQPRLKHANTSSENTISFVFQDATNLASIDDSHQHSLAFEFIDENTVLRKESYIKAGTVTPSTLRLVRQ